MGLIRGVYVKLKCSSMELWQGVARDSSARCPKQTRFYPGRDLRGLTSNKLACDSQQQQTMYMVAAPKSPAPGSIDDSIPSRDVWVRCEGGTRLSEVDIRILYIPEVSMYFTSSRRRSAAA